MAVWTASDMAVQCGGCEIPPSGRAVLIPAGEPYALVAGRPRCQSCAGRMGLVLNQEQVDLALEAVERKSIAEASRELAPAQALHQTTARIPARQPKSFASLGDLADRFDPRMAAAGDRE